MRKRDARLARARSEARCPFSIAVALTVSLGVQGPVAGQTLPPRDLTNVSLEDLMNIEVTSVSRKEQKLSKAAAAIYVINREDIRRSGATDIPDLLRLVPGVDVARIDAKSWAISIRGFNGLYANKVLVLVDGRSVYTPSFSGVLWDQVDVPLETIDRIEVIRGPGGTIWGANAVNGVINIITESAQQAPNGTVSLRAGSEEHGGAFVQYGGRLGKSGAYTVFGNYFAMPASPLDEGSVGHDARQTAHGGFRFDSSPSPRDTITFEGGYLHANEGETLTAVLPGPIPHAQTFANQFVVNLGDVLARWKHVLRNGSDVSIQGSFDIYHRSSSGLPETVRNGELEVEHHLAAGPRNDVVWGLGYRLTNFMDGTGFVVTILPHHQTENLFSVFAQDEIKIRNALSVTLGTKIEHNVYTGLEYEPSAQLLWTPTAAHTVWASASQAIRQPSRADYGISANVATFPLAMGGYGLITFSGNPDTKSERIRDYEIGYRSQINKRLALDLTAFLSYYHSLQTAEPRTPVFMSRSGLPQLVSPLVIDYKAQATDSGLEFAATWNINNHWKVIPSYSFLNMHVRRDASSGDTTVERTSGYSPRHQFGVRSFIDLPHSWEWDQTVGYVDALNTPGIPSYTRVDTRLGWRMGESKELSIVGQNLLQPRHREFSDVNGLDDTETKRGFTVRFTCRF